MNYTSCLKYIQLLETMSWIKAESGSESEGQIAITSLGRHMQNGLSSFLLQSPASETTAGSLLELSKSIDSPSHIDEIEKSVSRTNIRFERGSTRAKVGHNIMLVDDEQDVLATYKSILIHAGYQVDAFSQPELALEKLATAPLSYYDLLLVDIRMPRINGIQLYQRIRTIAPHVKIIFISSLDAAVELTSILPDIGDDDILKKPVSKQLLIQRIIKAVNSH